MNQAEVLKTAMKHIDRALNELDTVCPYYSNDYEALHRAKKALGQVLEKFANLTTGVVESKALAQPKQKYDYRVKYDRPCYKCRSNFCPGNCKEPKYLAQPEQRPVGTYEGVMETMLSLRKGTLEQQQIYTHMKDKLLYTAPPKREWVGLTGLEQKELMAMNSRDAVFETEAKLKEKNG